MTSAIKINYLSALDCPFLPPVTATSNEYKSFGQTETFLKTSRSPRSNNLSAINLSSKFRLAHRPINHTSPLAPMAWPHSQRANETEGPFLITQRFSGFRCVSGPSLLGPRHNAPQPGWKIKVTMIYRTTVCRRLLRRLFLHRIKVDTTTIWGAQIKLISAMCRPSESSSPKPNPKVDGMSF